jgi:dTMP kinase
MQTQVYSNFIVFEGIDGSGTTTQLKLLSEELEKRHIPHWATYEPTHGEVGRLIHNALEGSLDLAPETLAILFAADRNEHVYHDNENITTNINNGKLVVCDRYLFSSLAYQSVDCDLDFVAALNSRFPLPEYLFFLDTPFKVCRQRRKNRSQIHIFETDEYQKKVIKQYEKVFSLFAETKMQIIRLDGSKDKKRICQDVWKIVSTLPIVKR